MCKHLAIEIHCRSRGRIAEFAIRTVSHILAETEVRLIRSSEDHLSRCEGLIVRLRPAMGFPAGIDNHTRQNVDALSKGITGNELAGSYGNIKRGSNVTIRRSSPPQDHPNTLWLTHTHISRALLKLEAGWNTDP